MYGTREILRGKRDATATALSSVSVPWMQVRMIAEARSQPGMSALDVGGDYSSPPLAEIIARAVPGRSG